MICNQASAASLSLSPMVARWLQTIHKYHGSRYYGKAMNITRRLTGYDAALATNHLLLMPTTPIKATPLPPADAPRELYVEGALNMFANTAPTDISHHPAMAVPCRMSDGLPVSMMLIGKHFDEPAIYRAAYAFEQLGGARVALFSEF